MLLVIHNLPSSSKYSCIKSLLRSKCGLTEVILDNLISEGQTKRVTVGLADDGDAAILVRKINGLYVGGQQLYVEDVRQKKESEQPYRSRNLLPTNDNSANNTDVYSLSGYPRAQEESNLPAANMAYQNQDQMNMMMSYNMAAVGGMYYMPPIQPLPQNMNSYVGYGGQQQHVAPLMPQVPEVHAQRDVSSSFVNEREGNTRDWGSDNMRSQSDNRQRRPQGEASAPMAPRGARSDLYDRQQSGQDLYSPEDVFTSRSSRSPQRGSWDSRDRSDNNRQERFSSYVEPQPMVRRDEPKNYNDPPQSYGYSNEFSSNFAGQETFYETPSTSVLGSHATQPSASRWDQPKKFQNEYNKPDSFSPRRDRSDEPKMFGAKNLPPRGNPETFERRNHGESLSSRQFKNQRDEPRFPPKRESKGWGNGEPQPKRFAPTKEPKSQWQPNSNVGPKASFNTRNPQKASFNTQYPPKAAFNTQNPQKPAFNTQNPQKAAFNTQNPQKAAFNTQYPQKPAFNTQYPQKASFNTPNPKVPKLESAANDNKSDNRFDPIQKRLNKEETWRAQAASNLAKEMLKILKIDLPNGDPIVTHLKRSIRARFNIMLGNKFSNCMADIVTTYKQKFPPSGYNKFFTTVVNDLKEQKAKAEEAEKDAPVPKADAPAPSTSGAVPLNPVTKTAAPKIKPAVQKATAAPKNQPTPKIPAAKPAVKGVVPHKTSYQVPKFPEGIDKAQYKKIKMEEKKGWHHQTFNLPEAQKKALEEEVDTLCDIFMGECLKADKEEDKMVCEEIADVVSDEFRKIIKIHVSRRLLKLANNLLVRVHPEGGKIPRFEMEKFLVNFGATALTKSDRKSMFFLAHFDNYDNYDRILALGSAEVDGKQMLFKPFQVCGPPPSATVIRRQHVEKRKKFLLSQIDKSNEYILQPGYVYDPYGNKDGNSQHTDQSIEQGDGNFESGTGNVEGETGNVGNETANVAGETANVADETANENTVTDAGNTDMQTTAQDISEDDGCTLVESQNTNDVIVVPDDDENDEAVMVLDQDDEVMVLDQDGVEGNNDDEHGEDNIDEDDLEDY